MPQLPPHAVLRFGMAGHQAVHRAPLTVVQGLAVVRIFPDNIEPYSGPLDRSAKAAKKIAILRGALEREAIISGGDPSASVASSSAAPAMSRHTGALSSVFSQCIP